MDRLVIIRFHCVYIIHFSRYGGSPIYDDIPSNIMDEFRSYDFNFDGTIDPYEFISISSDLSHGTGFNQEPYNEVKLLKVINMTVKFSFYIFIISLCSQSQSLSSLITRLVMILR